jgi:heavy metal sensor kinase
MFKSLRVRLAVWHAGIVLGTFFVVGFVVEQSLSHTLSASLDDQLTGEINWFVERLEYVPPNGTPSDQMRVEIFNQLVYFPVKQFVEIYNASGGIFYRSQNLENDTLLHLAAGQVADGSTISTVDFRGHPVRLVVQREHGVVVLIAAPLDSVTVPIDRIFQIFLWIGPLVVIVSIAGGIYLANRSLGKMNQVITAAETITAEKLNKRLPEQEEADEIGRLISTFNRMIARLDSSFQQMKQFSADASHELRTPLAVLRSQLETALNEKIGMDDLKRIAANCLDETMRMSVLVDDLLFLAKADAGQQSIHGEKVNITEMIRDIYSDAAALASHKAITVTLKTAEEATVNGDEQRLRQMFLNLIDNAIKYNRERGEISLDLRVEDGSAVFTITDTGIGIPENELPKVFDRFYRVDKARTKRVGGVGLGLSIVKWTVEAHNGTIRATSSPGVGTTFVIRLPLAVNVPVAPQPVEAA